MRFLAALLAPVVADIHAVLLAGSSSYGNYRHQADVAHAYKLLRSRGVPAENIITMMVDDIANNSENPFPGKLYNKNGANPEEVYEGIQIDYKGNDVNPDVYLAVLKGDVEKLKTLTGKADPRALASSETDYVFLNFSDHGGTDIIECNTGLIHSSDLVDAVKSIKAKQLLYYLEACESGSMFDGKLDATSNIFAVTASNDDESSWGTYCPPDDAVTIDGKTTSLNSCLGDLFSVNWMEDTDSHPDISKYTVAEQVSEVTKETDKSHVTEFGNTGEGSDPLSMFLGAATQDGDIAKVQSLKKTKPAGVSTVDSRDIEVHLAYYKWKRAEGREAKAAAWSELQKVEKRRDALDAKQQTMHRMVCGEDDACHQAMHAPASANGVVECHKALIETYSKGCDDFNGYGLKMSKSFANMCKAKGEQVETLKNMVSSLCAPQVVV